MTKFIAILFVVLLPVIMGSQSVQAQSVKDYLYYEGEVAGVTSFFVSDAEGNTKVFSIGGLAFRGGVGVHNEEGSLFLGLHSGMEANFRHETGILPVYLNSRAAFEIGDEERLILGFGYGKSFQIGSENYKGFLRKYTIAIADMGEKNMCSYFVEITNHGFNFPDGVSATTLNIGFTYTFL